MTRERPTAKEVAQMIARTYAEPSKLVVVERAETRPDLIVWERKFDGVPVIADARSVRLADGWHTRFYRELDPPQPIRKASLIGANAARKAAGVTTGDVELVYSAIYKQQQKPNTPGNNAMDFVQVIERNVLTYRVKTRDHLETEIWIDAYSGVLRGRHSEYTNCWPSRVTSPKKH